MMCTTRAGPCCEMIRLLQWFPYVSKTVGISQFLTISLDLEKWCNVEREPIVKLVHWISLFYTYWILYMLNFICMYRQSDIRMYSYHCPDSRGFGDWSQPTDDTQLGTGRRPPALRHWPNTCSQFRPRRPANRPPPQPKSTKKLMDFNGFWWFMDCNIFQLILMDSNGWVLKPWGSKIMGFSWGFLNKKWVVDLCELQ